MDTTPSDDAVARAALLSRALEPYRVDVLWRAPRRQLELQGAADVVRLLLAEIAAMLEPRFTLVRRTAGTEQRIDEFVVRFVYAGAGIDHAGLAAGDLVELERLRILRLQDGSICSETCIETWSILGSTTMAPRR